MKKLFFGILVFSFFLQNAFSMKDNGGSSSSSSGDEEKNDSSKNASGSSSSSSICNSPKWSNINQILIKILGGKIERKVVNPFYGIKYVLKGRISDDEINKIKKEFGDRGDVQINKRVDGKFELIINWKDEGFFLT